MGGCLNFAEILRHLGDTGDKGDIPHGPRLNNEATSGRQGATFEATKQSTTLIVAPVAHLSPCRNPVPVAESSPISPCSPDTGEIPPQETKPATVSRWWLIHYPDREPVEVWTSPPATHVDVLADRPEAIAAEPIHEPQGIEWEAIPRPEAQTSPPPAPACRTCAHVTGRGGCGEPVAAGLSNLEGVIRYHPQGGKGCPAFRPEGTT